MGWNPREDVRRQFHLLQEFQPIKQAAGIGRVLSYLELAQPDEPADLAFDHLCKQGIKANFHRLLQPGHDGAVDPAFRRDKRIRAEALDHGYTRQDGLGPAALINKSAGQIMIGGRVLRLARQPGLQLACAVTGEHLEAVDLAQIDQMPSPRYVGLGVMGKLIHLFAKLCGDEATDGLWNDLTRHQQSARIPERTKLKGKAEAIACMATGPNDFDVMI